MSRRKGRKFFNLILPGLTTLLRETGNAEKIDSIDKEHIIDLYANGKFIELEAYLRTIDSDTRQNPQDS